MKAQILTSLLAAAAVLGTAQAQTLDLDYNLGGNGGAGSFGNTRTFEDDGVTLSATAWGYTFGSNDNAFQDAAVGRWGTGLGVIDRNEGIPNYDNLEHQVDNAGPDNFILFTFDTPVDIESVVIDPYNSWDRDVSYWVGNVDPNLDLTGETYADLAGLGFGSRMDDYSNNSGDARTVSVNQSNVNAILFGARIQETTTTEYIDAFKISKVSASVDTIPEPSSALLGLVGASALFLRRRRA